jgi:hypothetical protein
LLLVGLSVVVCGLFEPDVELLELLEQLDEFPYRKVDWIRSPAAYKKQYAGERKTFMADYERAGEQLVAICKGCQRTAILRYGEINRRGHHMSTLEEVARLLRCRNCRRKVSEVRLARSFVTPANRH